MKGERRHELKEDEFSTTVAEWLDWLKRNYKPTAIAISFALVVAALVGWYLMSSRSAAEQAWLRLAEAEQQLNQIRMLMFRADIDAKQVQEIRQDLVGKYRAIANDLPGTLAGRQATYVAGNLLYEQGKYDEAIDQYGKVIRNSTKDFVAQLAAQGIGYALEEKGQWAEAAEQFDRCASSSAGALSAQSRVDQGRCLEKGGHIKAATEAYNRAASLASESEWAAQAQKALERLQTETSVDVEEKGSTGGEEPEGKQSKDGAAPGD